jgi:hypothetical protein
MSYATIAHGNAREFNLNDPVDQGIVACLGVVFLCVIAILIAAVREVHKESELQKQSDSQSPPDGFDDSTES